MPAKTSRKRMLVFDLMRGFFMFGIIVNHLGLFPNLLIVFTGATKLWVSMAEGFFAISGFFVGFLYRERIKKSFTETFTKLFKRSFKLYLWSVYLTFLFVYWGNIIPTGYTKESLWIVNLTNVSELIFKVFTFRYKYGWTDILPYYSIFVLFSPFVLWGLNKGYKKTILFGSLILWFYRDQNIYLAVQPLYLLGLAAGFYSEDIKKFWSRVQFERRFKFKTFVYGFFVLTLFASIFSVYFFEKIANLIPFGEYFMSKNRVLNLYFDKQTVGIGRLLLSPLWILAGFFLFSSFEKEISKYFGKLLLNFGKNSLYAYILHAFVIFPIPYLVHYLSLGGIWWNTLISVFAISCVYLVLYLSSEDFKKRF